MAALIPLHKIFSPGRDGTHAVCHNGNRLVCWQEFRDRIAAAAVALKTRTEIRWLLSSDDPQAFTALLFALLHAGKQVVIPPNMQAGTLTQLASQAYDAIATADLLDSPASLAVLEPLNPNIASIDLYTSGSSGSPKRIHKTLAQFDAEVGKLEALWGGSADGTSFVATVPHHHIYGLLFRIFWPLSAGRPFDTITCTYPDILNERLTGFKDTVLVSSPAQLSRLPALLSLSSMPFKPRMIFSSGGPLPASTAADMHHAFGYSPTEIFGSTETGGIAWRHQNQGSAWTPFPGVTIRHNAEGQPLLHSTLLADDAPWKMDDAVELLEDGRFLLRGRLDRVVKIEEKRLSLPDMESRLSSHPWIAAAAALPLKGRRLTIGAVAVLNEAGRTNMQAIGKRETVRQLRAHLAATFEPVLLPKHWRFPDEMPADERGKQSLAALSALFGQQDAADGLLPDIISVQRNAQNSHTVDLSMHVPLELAHFQGHFPGLAILPGVVQLDWAVRCAREYLKLTGEFKSMENIKFQAIVLPETTFTLSLDWNQPKSSLEFSFTDGQRKLSSGRIVFGGAA